MSYNNEIDFLIQKIRQIDDCKLLLDHYDLKYRKNAKNYSMPCPLPNHYDTEPSFFINFQGLYYCHGCHERGDLISFVRDMEDLSFIDAVKRVAKIFGISSIISMDDLYFSIKNFNKPNVKKLRELDEIKMPEGCTSALDYYDVVQSRVTKSQIHEYDMLYAYEGFYKGSLIIPIQFESKCVAFFARDFGGGSDKPKRYNKNAPSKRIFFNYDKAIKNKEYVIIVEGIFDALKLIKYGYNTIACLGTHMSYEKMHLIVKNWEKVYIALDNDNKIKDGKRYNPGQESAKKIIDMLRDEVVVRNILLPTGKDPDECTKDEFDKAFYEARYV